MNEQFEKLISIFEKTKEDMHDENFIRIEKFKFKQCLDSINYIMPYVNKIISTSAEDGFIKNYTFTIDEIKDYEISDKDSCVVVDMKGEKSEKYRKPEHCKLDADYHIINPLDNNYKRFRIWYGTGLKGIDNLQIEIQHLMNESNYRISLYTYYKTKNHKNKMVNRMNILDFYF